MSGMQSSQSGGELLPENPSDTNRGDIDAKLEELDQKILALREELT